MRADTSIPSKHQDRLIHTLYGWYALTREPSDLGPFDTADSASRALSGHIKVFKGLNTRPTGNPKRIHLHDADQCTRTNCGLCVEARIVQESLMVAAL